MKSLLITLCKCRALRLPIAHPNVIHWTDVWRKKTAFRVTTRTLIFSLYLFLLLVRGLLLAQCGVSPFFPTFFFQTLYSYLFIPFNKNRHFLMFFLNFFVVFIHYPTRYYVNQLHFLLSFQFLSFLLSHISFFLPLFLRLLFHLHFFFQLSLSFNFLSFSYVFFLFWINSLS